MAGYAGGGPVTLQAGAVTLQPMGVPYQPSATLANDTTIQWTVSFNPAQSYGAFGVTPGFGVYPLQVQAASTASAYQATSQLSRVAGDFLVRRSSATAVVRLAAGIGAAGLLLVVLAPGPALAVIGFAVLGAGLAVVAPLTFSAVGVLAGDGSPDERRRRADVLVARLNQFNYLGFVLGGVLTGLVSSGSTLRWGYVVPLVTTAVLIALAPAFATRRAEVAS